MRFSYTSEQRAIADTVRRCLVGGTPPWPHSRWAAPGRIAKNLAGPLSELGLFGLLVPEHLGGSALRVVDGVLAVVEAGRQGAPFPLIEMLVATQAMARLAPEALDTVFCGRELATVAWHAECRFEASGAPGARPRLSPVRLEAVPFGTEARWIVARIDRGEAAPALVLFDASAEGVTVRARDCLDLTCTLADVTVHGTQAIAAIGEEPAWSELWATAAVLYAADLVGCASVCFERSLRHLHDREQFGQPIGRYQSLRHLAVDDHARLENSRLAVDYAAWALSEWAPDAPEAVRIAKAYASAACRAVAENSIQIHGGVGFTWDFPAHVALRRILRVAGTIGTNLDLLEDIAERAIDPLWQNVPAVVQGAAEKRP